MKTVGRPHRTDAGTAAKDEKGYGMANEEVESKILSMLEDICDDDSVYDERDVDLFEAGLLDSMGAIELLVDIEDTFGVVIAPTELDREEMNTVNKIIAQVANRL